VAAISPSEINVATHEICIIRKNRDFFIFNQTEYFYIRIRIVQYDYSEHSKFGRFFHIHLSVCIVY